ncbi:hypothetical protein PLICRDRAFT_110138 [Plicaturopsis crispa FD-325 SS-3]|nr:hypothetical protein PLICRDRAFT_110138 [Plicaturopsis crispa FD-325 SS-3]
MASTSLSLEHITDALAASPDGGATLDLTHKNLTDVGESGAEELATIGRENLVEDESSVLRIALGYNRLATLPMAFALLSRLRYLNLKNNSFSVFPDVLTVMNNLEILDISRNKIKRLPSQPGSLINLRVFSISRNKLTKLPAYIADFRHLNILKADHNPLEWPPKSVMEPPTGGEDPQEMKQWIRSVQKWMREGTATRKASDDSVVERDGESVAPSDESYGSWSRLAVNESEFDAGLTPHARSFSIDSDVSLYSDLDRAVASQLPSSSDSSRLDRPPALHLGSLPSFTPSHSPPRSPDSYLPTPDESVSSTDEEATADLTSAQMREHIRNASYVAGLHGPDNRLLGKKSLPDLRTARMNFNVRQRPPEMPARPRPSVPELPSVAIKALDEFSIPSPSSQRQDSGSSEGRSPHPPVKPFSQEPAAVSPTATDRPVPPMDVERNSYFKRLSALPHNAVAKTLPKSLLCLVETARSILFALTQVYQSLQHYTIYAIDDRLSSVLRKVLDPASQYMLQLIHTLDKFDTMSWKMLPPPAICRGVIESCRDTVSVFGKAVGVLTLQLKVLATHDDVRYLRQMILILYGAIAEISYAWQAMAPHMEAVQPLLRERRRPPFAKSAAASSPTRTPIPASVSNPESVAVTVQSPLSPSTSSPVPGLRARGSQPSVRTHTARRHAGSFSSKDVEIGKKLPSFDLVPPFAFGGVGSLRGTLRQATSPTPSTSSFGVGRSQPMAMSPSGSSAVSARAILPWSQHSRQDSQASLAGSSASSSPSLPRPPLLELPPNSKTLVDKEALDAMKLAVEAAPAVWAMMDDILSDTPDMNGDVQESLERAKTVTERLADNIRAVQQGDPAADRKTLREDAHVFVKTVVQLSNIIKTYGGTHAVSSVLRSKMVKLTNSTEEFVILLHVSSFSPSSTPRPYSPMLLPNPSTSQMGHAGMQTAPDDGRLGTNLSRSRSAQPSASSKLSTPLSRDGPRSAQPSQSFKINGQHRQGGGSSTHLAVEAG